jgi:hypothetical protein
MAIARTNEHPKEALTLLDQAFDIQSAHVVSGANQFNSFYDAAVVAGLLRSGEDWYLTTLTSAMDICECRHVRSRAGLQPPIHLRL